MDNTNQISVAQWHELPDERKEVLRSWATKHNYGLDIIQSETAETCDYAALLTPEQMSLFLKEHNIENIPDTKEYEMLWNKVKEVVNNH